MRDRVAKQLAAWHWDESDETINEIWGDDDEISPETRRRFLGQADILIKMIKGE